MDRIKIAILGTGQISHAMIKAMKKTQSAQPYAVASRSIERAEKFAKTYNIEKAYGSYEAVLEDPEVSLVYIATPHHLHYKQIKMCLNANKNVLCEKPMTINKKESAELFELARKRELFLSEAMWTRFLPAVKIVKNLLSDGCIGEPKFMFGTMSYNSIDMELQRDSSIAIGKLLDCGTYILTSSELIFGEEVLDITTNATLAPAGFDINSVTTLIYPEGKMATMFLSMDSEFKDWLIIGGEKGRMEIDIPYNWQNIRIYLTDGTVREVEIPSQIAGGYEYQMQSVCDAILHGKSYCEEVPPQKTLYIMGLMDAIREKWGLHYPCETD